MTAEKDDGWLVIKKELAFAVGKPVPSGFLVRAGSTAMRDGSPIKKRNRAERDRLVRDGVLVPDENPALFRFRTDYEFSSRSLAAGIVIDGNSNGDHWKENSAASLKRLDVEAAMDAYDSYRQSKEYNTIFDAFGEPREYWVRSTHERPNRVYPSKPIVGFLRGKTQLNAGWGQKADAAAQLHNAGYIIVDENDVPITPPSQYEHLIAGNDRIRLCARNYYIEPAREKGAVDVAICAGDLGREMGVRDRNPAICSALGSAEFQRCAQVPPPTHTEPNPSSSVIFTYRLISAKEYSVMKSASTAFPPSTNLILYGPPGTGKTYTTAWEAVRLCLGDDAAEALRDNRYTLMTEYRRLSDEGRIEFVTFHQSMAYEDFVEGRQPMTGADDDDGVSSSGFRLETVPGIFRRIAKRAETGLGKTAMNHRMTVDGRHRQACPILEPYRQASGRKIREIESGLHAPAPLVCT